MTVLALVCASGPFRFPSPEITRSANKEWLPDASCRLIQASTHTAQPSLVFSNCATVKKEKEKRALTKQMWAICLVAAPPTTASLSSQINFTSLFRRAIHCRVSCAKKVGLKDFWCRNSWDYPCVPVLATYTVKRLHFTCYLVFYNSTCGASVERDSSTHVKKWFFMKNKLLLSSQQTCILMLQTAVVFLMQLPLFSCFIGIRSAFLCNRFGLKSLLGDTSILLQDHPYARAKFAEKQVVSGSQTDMLGHVLGVLMKRRLFLATLQFLFGPFYSLLVWVRV